jgi:hypothetical protein
VLQVIAGLEAASAIGILHRDVKPSNCFVSADGRVLVGDFGLSIATLARGAEADAGVILGTPGFASPEQLRGDVLDLRSDIYSVGATLYYLLAGRAPFDDPDLRTMMTRVATEPPPALALARSDLPPRLAAVVGRCLAKKPSDRYASYASLRSALEPFRSASLTPAPLLRRLMAGAIDGYVAQLPVMPINMYLGAAALDTTDPKTILWSMIPGVIGMIAYFAILEGRFGCGAGKAIFNLRVVDATETVPGFRRALLRAAVYALPGQATRMALGYYLAPYAQAGVTDPSMQMAVAGVAIGVSLLVFGIEFSTARRRNGFAGLHDLASRTRVVVRPRALAERTATTRAARTESAFEGDRVGPYLVPRGSFARLRTTDGPLIVEGFDDRLRRRVWVELLAEGSPAVPAWRRDLARPGRVRWLSGRRQGADCWDAYEAVDGASLADAASTPQPWDRVRHWVADLAAEIAAGGRDGTLPPLSADRVWIDADDRARLLDLGSTGTGALGDAPAFLYGVAVGALRGIAPASVGQQPPGVPLPIPARTFLLALRDGRCRSPEEIGHATDLVRGPAAYGRGRRAAQIAVCAALPVLMPFATIGVLHVQAVAQTANPRSFAYSSSINQLAAFDKIGEAKLTADQRRRRDAIEVYIAEYLQDEVREAAATSRAFPIVTFNRGGQTLAERALARHKTRTKAEVTQAEQVVASVVANSRKGLAALQPLLARWALAVMLTAWTSVVIGCVALVGALATASGFTLRGLGAALVTGDGADASRLRALWRAVVTWLPAAVAAALVSMWPKPQAVTSGEALLQTLPLLALMAGTLWAIREPSRGIQDRLAGTRLVPR